MGKENKQRSCEIILKCMSEVLKSLVREMIIREEIGRNFHTLNGGPISYQEFIGYDVETIPTKDGTYILNVYFENKKLVPTRTYSTKEEAELYARSVVEKHRLSI